MLPFGILLALLLTRISGFATVRTFYCNWANNTWSATTNWIPTGTPQNGDALIFSAASPNKTSLNDLLNLKLDSTQITGSGYTIRGNGLTISTSVQLYGVVNLNGFNLALSSDGYLGLQGGSGGGELFLAESPNFFNGTFTHFSSELDLAT